MKRLIIALFLAAQGAFAALPTGFVWELRGGGATTNGGGFNPTNANMLTNAAATSATGNAPVITSASYNFVAGDVDAWVFIKAGTDWTPGWYKITSVGSNAATVNATVGAAVQVVAGKYTANTVAGCATTASPTGGTFTVDYSQQDASEIAITDAVSVGSSTTLTSVAALFTPVMVGNAFHLNTAGTGSFGIVGWYEIVSYNSTSSVETDITTNNGTALAAGQGRVGGGLLSLGAIGSATARLGAVAGNVLFLTGTFSPGADTFSCAGTATNPIQVMGYGTIRGDGYLGRTATTGKLLITTNFPTYTYTATNRLNASGATFTIFETMNIAVAGAGVSNYAATIATDAVMARCVITNPSTNTAAGGISMSSRGIVHNCDVLMTGASGGATAAGISAVTATRVTANYIRMSQSSSAGPAILQTASGIAAFNTIIGNGGTVGIYVSNTAGVPAILYNTIVGFVDGVGVITGTTGMQFIVGNMLTDNTSNAINFADAGAAGFIANNRRRDVTTITNGTNWVLATSFSEVTTDTGGPETDYVDSSNQDYRLIVGSPATSAAFPASASMGSRQRVQTGGGGQTSSASAR